MSPSITTTLEPPEPPPAPDPISLIRAKITELLTLQTEEKALTKVHEALIKKIRDFFHEQLGAPAGQFCEDSFKFYEQKCARSRISHGNGQPYGERNHKIIKGLYDEWQKSPGPLNEKIDARKDAEKQLKKLCEDLAKPRWLELKARENQIRDECTQYLLPAWEGDKESSFGLGRFNPAVIACQQRCEWIQFNAYDTPIRFAEKVIQELSRPLPVSPIPKA